MSPLLLPQLLPARRVQQASVREVWTGLLCGVRQACIGILPLHCASLVDYRSTARCTAYNIEYNIEQTIWSESPLKIPLCGSRTMAKPRQESIKSRDGPRLLRVVDLYVKEGRGPSERSNSVHTTPKCDASEFVGFRRSRRRRSRRQGRSSVGRWHGCARGTGTRSVTTLLLGTRASGTRALTTLHTS